MKKPVKLLSFWCGPKPSWYDLFVRQMERFETVDWECVPAGEGTALHQAAEMNRLFEQRLGTPCRKWGGVGSVEAMCDLRPAYGEVFADLYAGHEWWGWCDLDLVLGDLDRLLPTLLTQDVDAVSLKREYLSGCFAVFRNVPRMTSLFRRGPFREVLADPEYHCWDENRLPSKPGLSLHDVMVREGVVIRDASEMYACDSESGVRFGLECRNGRLTRDDGREMLLYHFMRDVWPLDERGEMHVQASD